MDHYKLKLLTSYEHGFVGQREEQGLIYLSYKNLILNFTLDEFFSFRRMTKDLEANHRLYPFPDGSERVMLQTPFEGINFSFQVDEIRVLVDAMDEAYYMQEIYSLIGDR